MRVYRVTHKKWSNKLIASGMPARWNSAGIKMICCAASRALACLENVVHRGDSDLFNLPFVTMEIEIPDDLNIIEQELTALPHGWNEGGEEAYRKCRPFGDIWYRGLESAVLKVPSAIIPGDSNYILNPDHPDFSKIFIAAED
ncbi:MAG: RES family NAD+ phosphorylase [Kosmotogaceae bacterium]